MDYQGVPPRKRQDLLYPLYHPDHELRCGDTIRLEHALTKRNLHSEEIFQSMITNGQEVSAFGEGGNGDDSTTRWM